MSCDLHSIELINKDQTIQVFMLSAFVSDVILQRLVTLRKVTQLSLPSKSLSRRQKVTQLCATHFLH